MKNIGCHNTIRDLLGEGFSLIELLVVICLVAILVSLLLPTLLSAKRNVAKTQCCNNLKQLGLAINMYSEEHGDQLPGPAWQGLYPVYNNSSQVFLSYYICKYLSLPGPFSTNVSGVQVAVCPASARITHQTLTGPLTITLRQPVSYIESIAVTNTQNDLISRPFGYPYRLLPNSNIRTNEPPKDLNEIGNPSSSWALQDADQQNAISLAQYYQYIPVRPAHDSIRNVLYFDWHIEQVKP